MSPIVRQRLMIRNKTPEQAMRSSNQARYLQAFHPCQGGHLSPCEAAQASHLQVPLWRKLRYLLLFRLSLTISVCRKGCPQTAHAPPHRLRSAL